jgi:hypothetical protein
MSDVLKQHPWRSLSNATETNNVALASLIALIGFFLAAIVVLVVTSTR